MSLDQPGPQRIAWSRGGMVSTQHGGATAAGCRILAAGGNAFDAAAAAAIALGVCEPAASGIGGQSLAMLHVAEDRKTIALDGSSRAPHRTSPAGLPRSEQLRGHRATTVPSTLAVAAHLVETHGRLRFEQVLEPAVELAEEGFEVSLLQHKLTLRELGHLRENSGGAFMLRKGDPIPVGDIHRQPVLAETLRRLQKHGWQDFYLGGIGAEIDADMEANDGLLRLDDLAQVPTPIERRPVSGRFSNCRILTFPPPGAGRTLLYLLNVLGEFDPSLQTLDSPKGAATLAEVIRRANLDRRDRPFDANLYPQIDDKRLLSEDYTKLVSKQVRSRVKALRGETTHLTVADGEGNLVALTQSIERVYGSCVATPGLGFLFNNYMSAFEYDDISHPYYLRPAAAPWASVAPAIVIRGRRPWLAIGSPGSARIASAIAQVLARRIQGQSLLDAITAPRLHCGLDGVVHLETPRVRTDVRAGLLRRNYRVRDLPEFAFYLGCVQAVERERDGWVGVADPRRDGAAAGP